MNRRCCIIWGFVFLTVQIVHAQSNFQKGFIIKAESDTIYGEIDNKTYFENAQFCDFKSLETNSITRYYPQDLIGYRFIDGKYYISKEVEGAQIFVEYLIDGKLDIYFYQDKKTVNHYYAANDSLPLKELKYRKGIKDYDGKKMGYKSEQYKNLLNYYISDYPELKNKLVRMNKPNHKNLIAFAEEYHHLTCKDEKCIIYEKKMPRAIKLNITGGPNFYFPNGNTEAVQKIYPAFGFNMLFQHSQRRENLYVGIGLNYEGFERKVSDEEVNDKISFLRIPLSFYYIKPIPGIHPFFAYEVDINSFFATQAIKAGLKYPVNKVSFALTADVKTVTFVIPYSSSINFGMLFDLR